MPAGQSISFKVVEQTENSYVVSTTAAKTRLGTKHSRTAYRDERMRAHGKMCQDFFNRLSSVESCGLENVRTAMYLALFRGKERILYKTIAVCRQSRKETLEWEAVTAILLQKLNIELLRSELDSNICTAKTTSVL